MPSAFRKQGPLPRNLASANRLLQQEKAAHAETRRELAAAERKLRQRTADENQELKLFRMPFETALHGAGLYVFSQDRDLRYTAISKPIFGRGSAEIIGHRDADILPGQSTAIDELKRKVLDGEQPADGEFRIEDDDGVHWHDMHIEPLRDEGGNLVGITGAAIDVTERKQSEAHLRLLMRELTHRSKNLLAVIQAMARQTARNSDRIGDFLDRFSARLQALSRSHDLLVQQSWHWASLDDLIHSQLSHYFDASAAQIAMQGPEVSLTPEAAQSLGLAFHELATNAAKYGALTVAAGRVTIVWRFLDDGRVEIEWMESGGPPIETVRPRGFGSMVIEHNLRRGLEADVELDFSRAGLSCRIVVPASQIV